LQHDGVKHSAITEHLPMPDTAAEHSGPASRAIPPASGNRVRRSASRTRTLFAGAALVVCGLVALVPWMSWDARQLAWDRAAQSADNLTATLANDIAHNLESFDLSLQAVVSGLRHPETQWMSPELRDDILFNRAASAPQFGAILVLDENGRIVIDSRHQGRLGESMADRDFFRVQRDATVPGLFVSAPFRSRRGEWQIALSRQLDRQDGRFAGIVVGSLRLDYIRQLFESVELGANASITLFRTDSTIMQRIPYDERGLGRQLASAEVFRHIEEKTSGSFEAISAFDGERRLYAYRRLGALPLVLAVGQASETILAEWRLKAAMTAMVTLGLVAVVLLLAGVLRAELRQRDRTETELAQKNATLAAILREMPDGVQIFDRDGHLVGWNEQAFRFADLDGEERDRILAAPNRGRAFRMTLARRGDYGPGDPDALVAGREATARSGKPTQFRRQTIRGRWLEMRGAPTMDGGWLGSYRDVTQEVAREHELRDAYERLRVAKDGAEAASRTKSEFLANMSHELRTPLNAIIGFSDMIRSGMLGADIARIRDYAGDINGSGQFLLNLINDILEVSRIEAGKLELQEEAVDLDEIVDGALRMLHNQTARAGIVIHKTIDKPLPRLYADQRRVSQVLLNLLSNAVKFTHEGGAIKVSACRRDNAMSVVIADSGIGIAADDLPRVLEPFGQVDSLLSRKHKGTGLGLPLSVRLMQLHGGRLDIESTVGTGTTVTITFPAERLLPDYQAA
jgi:signal transduction histidine kinase